MDESVKTFVAKFKGIEGVTIAERKRSLFRLFHSSPLDSQSQESVISKLQPQSHLEKLFLVEFLIHYRRSKELLQEFLKADDIIISKISHHKWFFQNIFAEMGPAFITQLYPSLSFSLKLKILKKITPILSESQADDIFDTLRDRYGISMATNILTCCSGDKIERVLQEYSVRLWTNQLKLLYDKNPHLIVVYLQERQKHDGNIKFMDSNPIFDYIAQKNPDLYYDLYKKYSFKIKLGKRVTKKLIVAKRNEIIAEPEIYVKNLNGARLVRKLGPDFRTVFLKLFPKRIEDSPNAESSRLLKFYPRRRQYDLMITTYNQIFHKKLDQCPHLIDAYVLRMIVDPDEREKLAKIKGGNSDDYLQYYRNDHCIQTIKERINFERSPYERANLVRILASTCVINDDYDAFLQVLEFILQRFKNDNVEVTERFLNELLHGGCNFNKFTEDHWDCINKITAKPYLSQYLLQEVCFHYIKFLYKVGKPLVSEIVRFFEKNKFDVNYICTLPENPAAEKQFLCDFIDLAPRLYSPSSTIENLDCQLILACQKYNKRNPKNTINILNYPRLIQSVKSALIEKIDIENNALTSALEMIVRTKPTSEEIEEILALYWFNVANFGTSLATKWFIRHRPDLIEKNLETFLHFAISKREINVDHKIWHSIKAHSHLNLDRKTLEFCLSRLNEESFKKPEFLAKSLSILMQPGEFLALIESHKPSSFKIDLQNETTNRQFQIQRNVLKEAKNINLPVQVLSLILQFCLDDYVHSCLSPLYSACYRASEDEIKPFIGQLESRGNNIAVKKHAFHLICVLFDVPTVLNALRLCDLKQSVAMSYKYFLNNPSNDCWELFKSKFSNFDKNDVTTLKLLASRSFPKNYQAKCFGNIWDFLVKTDCKKYKKILLLNVQHDTILELDSTIFATLVEDRLFVVPEIDKIVSKCLIYSCDQSKFDIIFICLEKFKRLERFSNKKLNNFIYAFFTCYMEWEGENPHLITNFLLKFQQIFPLAKTLEETITLTLLHYKNQNIDDFTKSIMKLHNDLILKYGETIVGIFAGYLIKLLPHFCKNNMQIYQFYDLLVNHRQSIHDLLLVIKLLPTDSEPEDKESFKYYDHTLTQLQEINLDSVQLHLNLHFKFHKLCLDFEYYERVNQMCINTSSWLKPGARRKIGYMYY